MFLKNRSLAAPVAASSAPPSSAASEPPRMGSAPLYAVGVYTSNIHETVQQYQRVFGVVPQDFGTPTVAQPNGESVSVR